MAGFIRRFTEQPPVEVIRQIEGVNIVDIAPPDPATGTGSGAVLLVGEFEDGFFATDSDSKGSVEVFGSNDLETKFGSFGFTHGGLIASAPCSRRHQSELWNGNGYLKSFKLKAQRLMIARVDTSVGSVSFNPLAYVNGGGLDGQTFAMAAGDTLEVTTEAGNAVSAGIAATAAVAAGSSQAFATISSGDTFGISVDGGNVINIVFAATDVDQSSVIDKINATVGLPVASVNATEVDLTSIIEGTGGSIVLTEVTSGVLAKIGHSAGTSAGTGDVVNINAVTSTELAAFVDADPTLAVIQVQAEVLADGTFRIFNGVSSVGSTIEVPATANPIADAAKLDVGNEYSIASNLAGTIPAGTRVSNAGGDKWVTTQTLDIEAGAIGPFVVKVRPSLDDGTALGDTAGNVNILVDSPSFAALTVANPADLTVALNEVQMDNAYIAAIEATLNDQGDAREANYLLIARRTDTMVREGRANAIKATSCGLFGRKFITSDPLGTSANSIIGNVGSFRSDRVFYAGKAFKVRVPAIAERGVAGGIGFTADGIITVRPDGPLATICASRPPEENPGQETRLIEDFFEVDTFGETLSIETYKAFRAAGVLVPRVDRVAGTVFQSGVTSSLETGRTTCARRKMADFIQDTMAERLVPFVKKLNTISRRNAILATANSFLNSLLNPNNPELQRIEGFSVDDSVNAGNTAESMALGIYRLSVKVRTLASLDFIVVTVEAGENAITVDTN